LNFNPNSNEYCFRSPLANAPSFGVFLALCAAVRLSETGLYQLWTVLAVSLLAPLSWILLGSDRFNRSSLSVFIILISLAAASSYTTHTRMTRYEPLPHRVSGEGTVMLERSWGFSRVALVKVREGKFLLQLPREGPPVREGDTVFFSGDAAPFSSAAERGEFDEYLYWKGKGARCSVENTAVTVRGRVFGPAAWRSELSERIEGRLPSRTAGYLLASWTGVKDPSLESLHRAAGTSHLLAVSGFHVGIAAMLVRRLLRGARHRSVLAGPVVWLYVALTGAAPSAVRAGIMIQTALLGNIFGRSSGAFNAAAAAGSAMLLFNPWIFWDVGWRLSMLAVLTLSAMRVSESPFPVKAFLASLLVWIATAPQSAAAFGPVPLAGLLVNCVALPVFGVLLPLASLLSLPAVIGAPSPGVALRFSECLFELWERFSTNLVFLFPWKIPFSGPLALLASAVLAALFASASGYSRLRAGILAICAAIAALYILVML